MRRNSPARNFECRIPTIGGVVTACRVFPDLNKESALEDDGPFAAALKFLHPQGRQLDGVSAHLDTCRRTWGETVKHRLEERSLELTCPGVELLRFIGSDDGWTVHVEGCENASIVALFLATIQRAGVTEIRYALSTDQKTLTTISVQNALDLMNR